MDPASDFAQVPEELIAFLAPELDVCGGKSLSCSLTDTQLSSATFHSKKMRATILLFVLAIARGLAESITVTANSGGKALPHYYQLTQELR